MMRRSVVLPDPLSPRTVRNSPSAISRETSRSTTVCPNVLATFRMLSKVGLSAGGSLVEAGLTMVFGEFTVCWFAKLLLLRRLHIVPDLGVFCAPRHILPEVQALLIIVGIIEMERLRFVRRHKLRGLRIRRNIMRLVRDQFLCLGLDHIFEEFVRQFLILAAGCDHEVIDPAGRIFLG